MSWYPVIFGCAWVLVYFLAAEISPYAIVRTLAVALIIGVGLCIVGRVLFDDGRRGAAFATLAILVIIQGRNPVILVGALIALGVLVVDRRWAWSGRTTDHLWSIVDRVGRGVALVTVLVVALVAVQSGRLAWIGHDIVAESPFRASAAHVAEPSAPAPDIYLILLDGYARSDTLRTLFGMDDRPLLAGLASRGFEVADQGHANYLLTPLSLASMLDMHLLDEIPIVQRGRSEGWSEDDTFRLAINQSRAFDLLRSRGYAIVADSPGYEHVAIRSVDRFVDAGMLNEAEIMFVGQNTAIGAALDSAAPNFVGSEIRARIDANLAFAVAEATRAASDGPKLVIAHVPGPHPPLAVDAEGRARDVGFSNYRKEFWPYGAPHRADSLAAYGAEVTYLGERVLETIDSMLAAAPEPPVIVLFSDHGTDVDIDWSDLDPSRLGERSGILFATLTPGRTGLFGNAPTLVNTLPILLDEYLGTAIELSPNVTYSWNGRFDSPIVEAE